LWPDIYQAEHEEWMAKNEAKVKTARALCEEAKRLIAEYTE
jgi:hypothetical protein